LDVDETRILSDLAFCREISFFIDRTGDARMGRVYNRPKQSSAVNFKVQSGSLQTLQKLPGTEAIPGRESDSF